MDKASVIIREVRGLHSAHNRLEAALAQLDGAPKRAAAAASRADVLRPIAEKAADDILRRLAAGR